MIHANQTLLFQGDSITDGNRFREIYIANDPCALGAGYAYEVASALLSERPKDNLKIFNRGISGNRITDLFARWRQDAIKLKPDVISILAGINDTWFTYREDTGTPHEVFEDLYRLLLQYTRKELPGVRFVLCEPFALACGGFQQAWVEDAVKRAVSVKKLAQEFDAPFVPFQNLFETLTSEAPAEYWLPDGVHPSAAAYHRMAKLWRETVGC